MRKHLLLALALTAMPVCGTFTAMAEPSQAEQSVQTITGTVLDENNDPVIGAPSISSGMLSRCPEHQLGFLLN